jgi:hypothetical protein
MRSINAVQIHSLQNRVDSKASKLCSIGEKRGLGKMRMVGAVAVVIVRIGA